MGSGSSFTGPLKIKKSDGSKVTFVDADGNIDAPITTTNLTTSGTTTLGDSGDATQINGTVTVGVDDTGYDVQLFGATSGKHVLWDESADTLMLVGGAGLQASQLAVTATADGLTTGLIPLGARSVAVTSASADNIITLPAGTAGQEIHVYVGANGCEMRTPATGGATINGVDSDGTNELALGATTSYICACVATDTWIVRGFTNLGADQAALVPDAA